MNKLILFTLSPSLLFFIYDSYFYIRPFFENRDLYSSIDSIHIYIIFIMNIFSLFSFLIIYFYQKKKITKRQVTYIHKSANLGIHYIGILIIFFMIELLVYKVYDTFNIFIIFDDMQNFYAKSKYGTAWIYYCIYLTLFLMMIDLYFNFNKKKILLIMVALIGIGLLGGRSIVLVNIILLIYITIFNRVSISLKYILPILLFSIIFFFGSVILRVGSLETYKEAGSKLDMNNVFVLNDVLFHQKNNQMTYLNSIEDFAIMLIPRSIYSDKPRSTAETRMIYPSVAERGTNYTFGVYGNLYFNLGLLFSILMLPLVLLLINYSYIKVFYENKKTVSSFYILWFSAYFVYFLRGGFINSRVFLMFIFLLISMFIYKIVLRIKL